MKKIQEYTLLILIIFQLVLSVLLISENPNPDIGRNLGIILFALGILFLISLLRKKFVDFILFLMALGGFSFGLVLLASEYDREISPIFLMPSFFIFFILWKDNFFTKESRNTPLDGTREKGKRMLEELREMGPDESMVGKTVIKKASVKKEEDKNSTEE
uniref:NADH dehydrogenase subunit 6 n=1 Tax=Algoriphagus sp. TaxID=1872435 RepID=UPI0040475C65